MSALALPLAEIELARGGRDPRYRIESPSGASTAECWCGRPFRDAARPVVVAEVPRELATYRGRRFHSGACAIAYASRAVNRIDAYLLDHPDGPRSETGRTLRELLVKLMGELLAFDLTWLSA